MLFKTKQRPGWLSLAVSRDRVDITHACRAANGRPTITLCESYRREGSLAHTMGRLRRERGLDQFRLTTLMPGGQYQLFQIDAPAVAAGELASALRWRIKDLVDFPVETAVIEALTIPVDGAAGGRASQVFAVVARPDAVRQHAEPLEASGLALAAVDIQELAQRNVCALFEVDGRGAALLAFDDTGGLLTVTHGGELFLARRVDQSLLALAQLPDSERDAALGRITLEVQRSLDHFDRQFGAVALGTLLLAGVGPVDELCEQLAESLYLPVRPLDLAEVADFPAIPELRTAQRQAQCLAGIGAALRGEADARAA